MNDDELRDRLRGEVPAPGPGYWENIDARLTAAASARPAVPPVDGAELSWDSPSGDTDADVIRLMPMDNDSRANRPVRSQRLRILAAAAAVVVVSGTGAALAYSGLRSGDGTQPIVPASSPSASPSASPTPSGPPPPADPQGRRICYQGGELGPGLTAYVDVDREGLFDGVIRSVNGGQTDVSLATGRMLDDTGRAAVAIIDIGTPGQRNARWHVTDQGLSLAEDVYVAAVACDTINADLAALAGARAAAPTSGPDATPVVTAVRDCYAGDGRTLVLDFSEEAEIFTGALRVTTGGQSEYQAVAGRRFDGTLFRVAVQRLGIGGDRTEEWAAGTSGIVLGDGTAVKPTACESIPDDVAELDARVPTTPRVPS